MSILEEMYELLEGGPKPILVQKHGMTWIGNSNGSIRVWSNRALATKTTMLAGGKVVQSMSTKRFTVTVPDRVTEENDSKAKKVGPGKYEYKGFTISKVKPKYRSATWVVSTGPGRRSCSSMEACIDYIDAAGSKWG